MSRFHHACLINIHMHNISAMFQQKSRTTFLIENSLVRCSIKPTHDCLLSMWRLLAPQIRIIIDYKCFTNFTIIIIMIIISLHEWLCRGLTSHSTLYRSLQERLLQVRWPNQQHHSTEGSQLATEISFSPTRTTPLCYNMNCTQLPLG